MRLDLLPSHKRLLRHLRRIDPNPSRLHPGEEREARELEREGLVEIIGGTLLRPEARITDAGRRAK